MLTTIYKLPHMRTHQTPRWESVARQALEAAIKMANGQTALARICGCTQGAVWQMLNKPDPMLSVQYALKVEAALGIPCHLLRPDIYPAPAVTSSLIEA